MSTPDIYEYPVSIHDRRISYYWHYRFTAGAKSILEVGCSSGFFSRYLVERGSRVVGVETNPDAAARAKSICSQVVVGDVESPAVQAQILGRFDAVLMGDVIEHLTQPLDILIHIRENLLSPEGCVVLSTPNSAHWIFRREVLRGRFPYRKRGLFDATHLRFFTRQSLNELAAAAGYRITDWAVTTNFNTEEDKTFLLFSPLYRIAKIRSLLNRFEYLLSAGLPDLFGYQYVIRLVPQ